MWEIFLKQWLEFWWVPRDVSTPAQKEEPVASAPKPSPERLADDLTVITQQSVM
jgi:hypothetical protein